MGRHWLGAVIVLTMLLLAPLSSAWARPEAFEVADIEIRGAKRISEGTVLNYLPVRTGETFGPDDARRAIRALYDTGLFVDVALDRRGQTLVVTVKERPAIAEVNINGSFSIDEEVLRESLSDIGLARGRTFDRALLRRVDRDLRRMLFSRGNYGMELETEVRELERNRVAIDLTLNEGKKALIRQIEIVGNEVFDDETLKDQMDSGIPGFFQFFSSADEYSRQRLEGDLQNIRSYYQDRGYIRFAVTSTQVTITPDKKDIYITINVEEGEKYDIRDVEIEGRLPLPRAELRNELKVKSGQLFSRKDVVASRTAITDRLAREGFAFAQVDAVPRIDEEERRVDLRFVVEPGTRAYVRRVSFSGHVATEDRVYRRELRQIEGGLYSPQALERSRIRLQRLPQVTEVQMTTSRVQGATNMVDVNYHIEERRTGSFSIGAGLDSTSGIAFNVSLRERNLLGTGNDITARLDTSEDDQQAIVEWTDPFFTSWGVSRTIIGRYRQSDPSDFTDARDFFTDEGEVGVRFGVPLSEFDTLSYGGSIGQISIDESTGTPVPISAFLDERGTDFTELRGRASFTRDTRNRTVFPDTGTRQSVTVEATVPGSDVEYYKLDYEASTFMPLGDELVFSPGGRVAIGDGFGDDEELPFFRRFFAGGIRSVRGFEPGGLGPEFADGDARGGDFVVTGSAELIFPPPFLEAQADQFRLSAFYDFGNVFIDAEDFDPGELRSSVGLAIHWRSAFGPLVLSIAEPVDKGPTDDTQQVQFSFGTLF